MPSELPPLLSSPALIYGLGRSGRGVLRFLARERTRPGAQALSLYWHDAHPSAEDLDLVAELGALPADLRAPNYRTVIAAPGVPIDHPDLQRLRGAGAEIIGEVELAARLRPHLPVVGVTGTAGKGSTTVLIAQLLRASGLRAVEGGNIDPPLLDVVDAAEVAVVELSSFQLERVVHFAPPVAVITNLGLDHLDRHGSLETYHAAKANITRAQGPADTLITPPGVQLRTRAQVQHFDAAQLSLSSGEVVLALSELPEGVHPANAAAALLAAEALLLRLQRPIHMEVLAGALRQARPMKGRFETVARVGELRFINDSIATRTVAVQAALQQAAAPIAWLVGGRDKGADLAPLRQAAAGKVAQVIAFGEDGEQLARELGLTFKVVPFDGQSGEETLRLAVALALEALPGSGSVLLAPVGTSFDLFGNYIERGEAFTRVARSAADHLQRGAPTQEPQ